MPVGPLRRSASRAGRIIVAWDATPDQPGAWLLPSSYRGQANAKCRSSIGFLEALITDHSKKLGRRRVLGSRRLHETKGLP